MGELVKLSETSPEWRRGFIFAVTAIADMGKNTDHVTIESFIKVLEYILWLNEKGIYFE